jgi:hypothetical protein
MTICVELTDQEVCGEPGPNVYFRVPYENVNYLQTVLENLEKHEFVVLDKSHFLMNEIDEITVYLTRKTKILNIIQNNKLKLYLDDRLLSKTIIFFESEFVKGEYTYFLENDDEVLSFDANIIFEVIVD